MSIVSATDSFVMLRAYHDKGTTRLPNTSTIRKYELLFLNFLEANFKWMKPLWRLQCQSPQILGPFSQVPVFHGISLTKSPRPPSSTLVGQSQPSHWHSTLKGEPGREGGIRGRITKLGNFGATVFCCLIAHLSNWGSILETLYIVHVVLLYGPKNLDTCRKFMRAFPGMVHSGRLGTIKQLSGVA